MSQHTFQPTAAATGAPTARARRLGPRTPPPRARARTARSPAPATTMPVLCPRPTPRRVAAPSPPSDRAPTPAHEPPATTSQPTAVTTAAPRERSMANRTRVTW